MRGFIIRMLCSSVFMAALAFASPAGTEKLTEVEQLKVQVLLERQRRIEAELNAALGQCQASANVRQILNQQDQVNKVTNDLVNALFTAHKVDTKEFKLNPETGEFVPSK